MSYHMYLLSLVALIVIWNPGCKDNTTVGPTATPPVELISNISFEPAGTFSLAGWTAVIPSRIDSIHDAPSGGGHWSVGIGSSSPGPAPSLHYAVGAPEGRQLIRFSVMARYTSTTVLPGGTAALIFRNADTSYVINEFPVTDSLWTQFSATDTLTLDRTDTLEVILSGTTSGAIQPRTIFDLCRLEQLK